MRHFSDKMGLSQRRERIAVEGVEYIGVGKWKLDLIEKDVNDILHTKGKMSNKESIKKFDINEPIKSFEELVKDKNEAI